MTEVTRATGWASMPGPDGQGTVHMRLEELGGELVVTELYMRAPKINAAALRKIQIAPTEAHYNMNWPLIREVAMSDNGTVVTPVGSQEKLKSGEFLASDSTVTLDALRQIEGDVIDIPDQIVLSRPDGTDPEAFYRRVADAYRSAAAISRKPVAILSDEADVPVATVRNWVNEARRRGYLPQGKKGKIG